MCENTLYKTQTKLVNSFLTTETQASMLKDWQEKKARKLCCYCMGSATGNFKPHNGLPSSTSLSGSVQILPAI